MRHINVFGRFIDNREDGPDTINIPPINSCCSSDISEKLQYIKGIAVETNLYILHNKLAGVSWCQSCVLIKNCITFLF